MNDKPNWIRVLEQHSRLDTTEAIHEFDQALERLAQEPPRSADLPSLFAVFRDDCANEEVMFGLVHLLEDLPLNEFIAGFLDAAPQLIKRAPKWARTFHFRILNSAKAREVLKGHLSEETPSIRHSVEAMLRDIAENEDAPLAERAQSVLSSLQT